jgi:hypothetical protein
MPLGADAETVGRTVDECVTDLLILVGPLIGLP